MKYDIILKELRLDRSTF